MDTNKKTGRVVGALFIIVMLLWFIGFYLVDQILTSPDYLADIYPNKTKVKIGVLFELLETAAVLGITFILYPILKKYHESLAIGYVGFRIFESIMLIVALICPLILITLSQEFIQSGFSDASYFETLGNLLKETREDWSLFILAFFHPLAAIPLYYFLYQTKLVPRFISGWGFLAALLVLIDQVVLESFGLGLGRISGNPITGIPMGLNEIVLGVWLVIKGFNESALVSDIQEPI